MVFSLYTFRSTLFFFFQNCTHFIQNRKMVINGVAQVFPQTVDFPFDPLLSLSLCSTQTTSGFPVWENLTLVPTVKRLSQFYLHDVEQTALAFILYIMYS